MNDNLVSNTEAFTAQDLTSLTWNIESAKNNIFLLKDVLEHEHPSLVFLSEPQVYQSDISNLMDFIKGDYCYFLNSEDIYNPDLPLVTNHASGGTLCLWRRSLDAFVTVQQVSCSAFTPIILTLPNHQTSIHICIYLPTHGRDAEFISALADLKICIDELLDQYPDAILFVRGDGNVNRKNKKRVTLLEHFITDLKLTDVKLLHKTYHHFTGGGAFDSNVDILLHSSILVNPEIVTNIMCKLANPLILSHHDIILSKFSVPSQPRQNEIEANLITAPRLELERNKITWTDEGIKDYEQLVSSHLQRVRERWLNPDSLCSMSMLLKMTNSVLSRSAQVTNTAKNLKKRSVIRSAKTPKLVLRAKKKLSRTHKSISKLGPHGHPPADMLAAHNDAKQEYKAALRRSRVQAGHDRDRKLFTILDENPQKAFGFLKSCRKSTPAVIESLKVGPKVYHGKAVSDGFFDSMSSIKSCNFELLSDDPHIAEHLSNHEHILKLCKDKRTIPSIDLTTSTELLRRMRKDVSDIFSITALHYLNAGNEGLSHFNLLLNAIIVNVNNATLEELNLVLGLILYKGHNKEKTSDRSYRTISTCPFMAKAVDLYLHDLFHNHWDNCQAETQYQGHGSNHELAALLVTEVIQHSLNVSKKPVFLLSLDAQSAYDRCLRQILSSQLYKAEVNGTALTFIDKRLSSRATVYQWDGETMGPAGDDTGFEQGGINSSDFYKLYNNEQLASSQRSRLGVNIRSSVISSIGQADDVIHAANTIDDLRLLATITENYCKKYRVTLVPSKTKLLVFSNDDHKLQVDLAKLTNPIKIDNVPVKFCQEAEHVGILRNVTGNLPNLLNRIIAHKKSLGALLSAGLARSHRGNPAASLRVHQLYETPVLFSGLAALVLTKAEIGILDSHYLTTLQNIQRLHDKTPRAVVLFLAGSLPGAAILHSRQLTLFSMICRLPGDPLHAHAHYVLTCSLRSAKSWFQQVRDICLQYSLPHPLELLQHPLSKHRFKTLVKKQLSVYWENHLRLETIGLSSLIFFNTSLLSLQQPSLLWLTAGSNSFECSKSLVVAKMISGRYRSDYLCRHWTPSNRRGFCLADTCQAVEGDVTHMLIICPALQPTRDRLVKFWRDRALPYNELAKIISEILSSPPQAQTQFILDPCLVPAILALCNQHGKELFDHVYYLTRTYAYYMHRAKMISLGRWPGDPGRKAKVTTLLKKQPKNLLIKNICNQSLDHLTSFSVAGTPVHDQPVPVHSSLTTLSTASHTHTLPNTPMPGLITCAGHQQQTAGYGHVPHTASHAAHHGAGERWVQGVVGGQICLH